MTRLRILVPFGLATVVGLAVLVGPLATSGTTVSAATTVTSATTTAPAAAPTTFDQYALELVNSMRANPQAAANAWLGGNLNEGLAAGTLSTSPKQPLAFNADLESSAQTHNNDMLTKGYFSHTGSDGSSPFARMTAAGYNWQTAGENIAAVSDNAGGVTAAITKQMMQNLFVDSNVAGRGHRINLLTSAFQAVGISNGYVSAWAPFNGLPSAATTQDFGSNGAPPVLTGVAFNGTGNGSFYAPGHAYSGVKVTVATTGATPKTISSVLTSASGGFAIAVPANGCYSLTFTRAGVSLSTRVAVAASNVEVDYTPTAIVAPGGAFATDSTFTATC